MKYLHSLQLQLQDLIVNLRKTITKKENFTAEKPTIFDIAKELEDNLQDIQTEARDILFQFEDKPRDVTPKKESIQIIVSTSIEALEALKEMIKHIRKHQTQSQVKKGLTQLLEWTSHLDYAEESARMLLRLLQRIDVQLRRFNRYFE